MRFILSLFLLSLSISSAFAQTLTWSDPPEDLSVSEDSFSDSQVQISVDGSHATAVWVAKGSSGRVELVSRSATIVNGIPTWGASTIVSDPQQEVSATNSAALKLSSDGSRATVAWVRKDVANNKSFLQTASASILGNVATWGGVTELNVDAKSIGSPLLALSEDGSRALVGTRGLVVSGSSLRGRIFGAVGTINGASATWGAAKKISDSQFTANSPAVALAADGSKGIIAWSIQKDGGAIVQASTGIVSQTSATWGNPSDISAVGFISASPQVALSSDGTRATVWWLRTLPTGSILRTRSALISGLNGVWGGTSVLSAVNVNAGLFSGALSSDGTRGVVTWLEGRGFSTNVFSAVATIAGENATWGSRVQVNSVGGAITAPSVRLSADGSRAFAVWARLSGSIFLLDTVSAVISGETPTWGAIHDLGDQTRSSIDPSAALSGDAEAAVVVWQQPGPGTDYTLRSSAGVILHPTPTPTPVATDTPTPTPTAAPTATPIGSQSNLAPVPAHSSNDGRVVLRIRDYPNSFSRDYYGYLLRASDYKVVAYGKFTVRNRAGRLVLHVAPGEYVSFSVVYRSKAPTVASSKFRRITVK